MAEHLTTGDLTTGGSGGSPDLDNVIAWERIGFKGGNYTSGTATVVSNGLPITLVK